MLMHTVTAYGTWQSLETSRSLNHSYTNTPFSLQTRAQGSLEGPQWWHLWSSERWLPWQLFLCSLQTTT